MDAIPEDWNDAVRKLLDASASVPRYGWKRTQLDQGVVEYITDRQRVIDALRAIQQIDWRSINCDDRELAITIREFALHSLATMAQAMAKNEERIL